MFYTIYQITNITTGHIYIGLHKTSDLDDDYMGSGNRIVRAIRKHGVDKFEKKILHVFNNEPEMISKEVELVTEEFCNRDDTYNICPGGKGGWGYVNSINTSLRIKGHTQEMYDKISDKLKGKAFPHMSENMKIAHHQGKIKYDTCGMLGKFHSDESKEKMSSSQSGKNNSQFGSMWINNGSKARKIKKYDPVPNGWSKGRHNTERSVHRCAEQP